MPILLCGEPVDVLRRCEMNEWDHRANRRMPSRAVHEMGRELEVPILLIGELVDICSGVESPSGIAVPNQRMPTRAVHELGEESASPILEATQLR